VRRHDGAAVRCRCDLWFVRMGMMQRGGTMECGYEDDHIMTTGRAHLRKTSQTCTWIKRKCRSKNSPSWGCFSERAQGVIGHLGCRTGFPNVENCGLQCRCPLSRATSSFTFAETSNPKGAYVQCCIRQGLSPVLMPLPGLAPVSPYFGLRPVRRLSLPK